MNYSRIYDQLIERGVSRGTPKGYYERHHIIPRSMGGSDDATNLVNLTAREHFLAHICLGKIHGGTMWFAITMMKGNQQHSSFTCNSKLYEIAKREHAMVVSIAKKGSTHSKKTKSAISIKLKGRILSEKHKASISSAAKGKPLSNAHKLKVSEGLKRAALLRKQQKELNVTQ
jgi:hypothetical protein